MSDLATHIPSPCCSATGIGALPHLDPEAACRDVLAAFPRVPYIPVLPNRGLLEGIVFNDSGPLPGRVITEGRLFVDTVGDHSAAMEQIYLDFVEGNAAPYGAGEEYVSALYAMKQHPLDAASLVKCQVTGPVTFGMQVVDEQKRPILYDETYADLLGKMLGLRARWFEQELRSMGAPETLVVLNEPYLASLGSSVVPVDASTVQAQWEDIASMLEGGLGVHCCSNTDWNFVTDLDPAVLSLDAYVNAREFLLYSDRMVGYMEQGGVVAWGIVPADQRVFVLETIESLTERFMAIRATCADLMDVRVFDRQSMITPSCGIRFADEAGSREIMQAAATISRTMQSRVDG